MANVLINRAASEVFVSDEITGSGSAQSTPHGLQGTPSAVFVTVTDNNNGDAVIVEGVHDGVNVIVTLTNAVLYKVIAFL